MASCSRVDFFPIVFRRQAYYDFYETEENKFIFGATDLSGKVQKEVDVNYGLCLHRIIS